MAFHALTKLGSDLQVAPLEYLLQKLKYETQMKMPPFDKKSPFQLDKQELIMDTPLKKRPSKKQFPTSCGAYWNRSLLSILFRHDHVQLKQENKAHCNEEADHCVKSLFP